MNKILNIIIILVLFVPQTAKAQPATNIVISEIQITGGSGHSTDEFVELYNPTDSIIDLTGWQLAKKTASGNEYVLVDNFSEQSVAPDSYYLITHPIGYTGSVSADSYYTTSNSIADNNTVVLLDADEQVVDAVGFGSAIDYEGTPLANPGAAKSVERKARADSTEDAMVEGGMHYFLGNGHDTDDNHADFIGRAVPEPQNSLSEPEYADTELPTVPDQPGLGSDNSNSSSDNTNDDTNDSIEYSKAIIISELFPNPEGRDDGEFIELYNTSGQPVDLVDWQVGDESSRRYTIQNADFTDTVIKAHGYFVIQKEISGISLNNTGDAAQLYNPDEVKAAEQAYIDCQEEQSYSLVNGQWQWTDEVTPGYKNVFIIQNELPEASIEVSNEEAKINQTITFDASDTEDADGDAMEFIWDFGDGTADEGRKAEHAYSEPGSYLAVLSVIDEKGGEAEAEVEIEITGYDYSDHLLITELLPSCSPSDKECEFIEIYNPGDGDIALTGWQLTDRKGSFVFTDEFIIEALSYLVVERSESRITLNNSGDIIYLIDPDGTIINGVEYEKASKDSSFSRTEEGGWAWTEEITQGSENVFTENTDEEEELLDDEETEQKTASDTTKIELAIGDVSEDYLGKILTVTGEVEKANSRGIYLMDEYGNVLRAFIQKSAGIEQPALDPGDMVTITGVLDKTSAGLRLLPRTAADIEIHDLVSEPSETNEPGGVLGAETEKEVIELPPTTGSQQVTTYLLITLGVVAAVVAVLGIKKYKQKKKNPSM